MKKTVCLITFLVCLSGLLSAAPLNLVGTLPDIASTSVSTTYTSSTHILDIQGTASVFTETNGTQDTITPGASPSFHIVANIGSSGQIIAGTNSLTITGSVAALGAGTPLLSASNLTAFGFNTSGTEIYEFVFTVPSSGAGSLAGYYGPTGTPLDVIVTTGSITGGIPSNFTANSSTSGGLADVRGNAPEPGTLLLLASGGSLIGILRRRFSASLK